MLVIALAVSAGADVVTDWNNVILEAIRTDKTPPPKASRALAMVHAAVFDSVNGIARQFMPYKVETNPPSGASLEAAAATAAHRVLMHLYPAQFEMLDEALDTSLGAVPDGDAKKQGEALGRYVGGAIVALRLNDHSADIVPYTPVVEPGKWRPTPPKFASFLLPNWATVTPFGIESGSQFRASGPLPLTSAQYANAMNEVRFLGSKNSPFRTEDQTEIALFWADNAGTATPPGHWNQIAQVIAADRGNSLMENARLFALLNIAMADAGIAAWDCKYAFDFWRPITAIREADTDNNPMTQPDKNWEPLIETPPFPECVSGHSTFSGAAGEILALVYGNDTSFTVGSDALPGVTRHYSSILESVYEAGRSRIYGGIHFEFSNLEGIFVGRDIGYYDARNYLQPVAY